MDKTELNESTQKNIKISAKQAEEIKISRHIAGVLKREWEELAKKQEQRGVKIHAGRKISSITLTKNRHGKVSVQINMQNGARLLDNAREKNVISFKEKAQKVYSRAKVEELLKKIKEYGYAAVEGEIPAELKEAVLKAMDNANISTSYKGEKAEAEAAREASQRAADFANDIMNPSIPRNNAGTENYIPVIFPPIPYDLPKDIQREAEKNNERYKQIADETAKERNIESTSFPRLFSPAIRQKEKVLLPNGTEGVINVKGSVHDAAINSLKTQILLAALQEKEASPAVQKIRDDLEKRWQKKHPGESCSTEALINAVQNGELVYEVSLNSLQKEYHQKNNSYNPEFKKALDGLIAKENEAKKDRANRENAAKRQQIETALSAKEDELTPTGKELKALLKQNGISSREDMNSPDKKETIDNILKQNKYFIQRGGSYFNSCRLNDVNSYDEAKKRFAKRPCNLQHVLEGTKSPSEFTFEDLYQDSRSRGKYLAQPIKDQQRLLNALRQKNGMQKSDLLTADIVKEVKSLYAEFQSEKQKDSSKNLQTFLSDKKLIKATPDIKPQKDTTAQKAADKAAKEALLAPGNAVSAEKIRQAKAVLDKEANGEPLSEKEQKLLNFVHQTFSKIPDLKKEDLEDPKNSKQLAQMLQCKKLYSNLPKEEAVSKQAETSRPAEKPVAKQQSGNTMGSKPAEKPVAKQQSVPAAVQSNHPQQTKMTEKERVISKIKENMETFKNASETGQTPQKPETVKKSGLQQKIQQKQQTANSSVQQQTAKPSVQQQTGLSSAMRIALINKKERE